MPPLSCLPHRDTLAPAEGAKNHWGKSLSKMTAWRVVSVVLSPHAGTPAKRKEHKMTYEEIMEMRAGREWEDGDDEALWDAGYEHARAEIRRGLNRTGENRLKECRRLQSIIDERCEEGSLMGYSHDGRIRGIEETLAAIEASLERMGIELGLDWS